MQCSQLLVPVRRAFWRRPTTFSRIIKRGLAQSRYQTSFLKTLPVVNCADPSAEGAQHYLCGASFGREAKKLESTQGNPAHTRSALISLEGNPSAALGTSECSVNPNMSPYTTLLPQIRLMKRWETGSLSHLNNSMNDERLSSSNADLQARNTAFSQAVPCLLYTSPSPRD